MRATRVGSVAAAAGRVLGAELLLSWTGAVCRVCNAVTGALVATVTGEAY